MPTTHTRLSLHDAARICRARGLSRAEAELELSQPVPPADLMHALDAAYAEQDPQTATHSAANF